MCFTRNWELVPMWSAQDPGLRMQNFLLLQHGYTKYPVWAADFVFSFSFHGCPTDRSKMPTWQCSTRVELLLCDNVQFSLAFTSVLMGGGTWSRVANSWLWVRASLCAPAEGQASFMVMWRESSLSEKLMVQINTIQKQGVWGKWASKPRAEFGNSLLF